MDNREQLRRITELTEQIAGLPKGYLSKKTIGGKVYYYHQWSENGVKQSRYLHDSEIAPLADKIEKRKELQAQLRMLKSQKSRRNEATGMKCTFMHKRTPVAELELDDVTGFIQKIGSVYAPEHLPIGIPVRNEIADRAAFNDWWRDRSIPASRSGAGSTGIVGGGRYQNAARPLLRAEPLGSVLDLSGRRGASVGGYQLFPK